MNHRDSIAALLMIGMLSACASSGKPITQKASTVELSAVLVEQSAGVAGRPAVEGKKTDIVMANVIVRDSHGVVISTPRIFWEVGQTASMRSGDGEDLIAVDVLARRDKDGVKVTATLKNGAGAPVARADVDAVRPG